MVVCARLEGSFRLNEETIAEKVTENAIGAYALGFSGNDVFTVQFVGRADMDLRAELLAHAAARKYLNFKFVVTPASADAFDTECALFHEFGGLKHLDNAHHPQRPSATQWRCSHCTIYGVADWGVLAR